MVCVREYVYKFDILIAADQSRVMEEQMSGAAMAMPQDPKQAFKAEWEALQMCQHQWALKNVDADIIGRGVRHAITSAT